MEIKDIENKILNADCMDILKQLPDKCIDLVLTDPPYNISRDNNFDTMKGRQGFDFGNWDKGFNQRDWLELATRKVKEGGSIIVFNSFENIGLMADVFRENNIGVKCLLRWVKPNPFPRNVERLYVNNMELALWGVCGSGWAFNKPKNIPYMTGEFNYPVVAGEEKTKHPTQKSLKLFENILSIHSNENDIVLDCFSGSGTTAIACHRLKRRFICIEKDKDYWEASVKRLEDEQRQGVLF